MAETRDEGIQIAGVTIGYNSRCKLCNFEKRAEVERAYMEGLSFEKLHNFIMHDLNFKISFESVRNHINKHFLVREHAREQLARSEGNGSHEESAGRRAEFLSGFTPGSRAEEIAASTVPVLEDAAARRIADVDMLDELALQDFTIRKQTTRMIRNILDASEAKASRTKKDLKVFLPIALIQLHTQSSQELRQNRKTRAEIMGEVNNGSDTLDLAAVLVAAHDLREKHKRLEEDEYNGEQESGNSDASDDTGSAPGSEDETY